MHWLDWALVVLLPLLVIWDGVRRGREAQSLEGFVLAGRKVRWWTMGMSVMATQASAITMISITGHGFQHGMRWLHAYIALPFAMVILCATVVPWFRGSGMYTAYEWLEKRFDRPTRMLASVLFLVSRGVAIGVSLVAPAVVLEMIMGLPRAWGITLMGGISCAYTVYGGNAAVIFTDVKQMLVMFLAIAASLYAVIHALPAGLGFGDALAVAGAAAKLETFHIAPDFRAVLTDKYNVISGLFGGLFLFLGYFGADQSQVQRYLAGSSVDQSRFSLLLSAFAKVPMQFAILLLGALIWVHYIFAPSPLTFREEQLERVLAREERADDEQLVARAAADRALVAQVQAEFDEARTRQQASVQEFLAARDAAAGADAADGKSGDAGVNAAAVKLRAGSAEVAALRKQANALLVARDGQDDTDFIYPWFFLRELPVGLLGLVLAAIFVAAMSSLDGQLNSLATSSVLDLWSRFRERGLPEERQLVLVRWMTLFWGLFATVSAFFVARMGPLIEAVNFVGSMFYGSLFGVFLLGWVCRGATGFTGFLALGGGFGCVVLVHLYVRIGDGLRIGFFWYNLIGCAAVVLLGALLSLVTRPSRPRPSASSAP